MYAERMEETLAPQPETTRRKIKECHSTPTHVALG